jgi:uncharacterized membrane protein
VTYRSTRFLLIVRGRSIADPGPEPSVLSRSIAAILVAGVGLSAVVLAFGLVLLAVTGRTGYSGTLDAATILSREGSVVFPHTVADVAQGVVALRPFAVIEFGALLLIATPVVRVAASAVLFLVERDYLYTVVTAAVLVLLLVSNFWLG